MMQLRLSSLISNRFSKTLLYLILLFSIITLLLLILHLYKLNFSNINNIDFSKSSESSSGADNESFKQNFSMIDFTKTILTTSALIISAVSVIFVFVNIFVAWQGKSYINEIKTQIDNELKSFQDANEEYTSNFKNLNDDLGKLREEFKDIEGRTSTVSDVINQGVEVAYVKQCNNIINTLNSVMENITEVFTDRLTIKRLEVIRSKTFFNLGDNAEKKRSIQYIGFIGNNEDVIFLDDIEVNPDYSAEIRLAAQKAKFMIQKRNEKILDSSEDDT
ncbi:MAG: hypothetical protein GY839_16535 [candidate division Zixibacteria bacterium]|nr:hypothetical protein [candidate division Zixibacteria bacterium]